MRASSPDHPRVRPSVPCAAALLHLISCVVAAGNSDGTLLLTSSVPAAGAPVIQRAAGGRRLQTAAACTAGQRYDSNARACVACAPGYAQPMPGQSSCTECAAGKFSTGSVSLRTWTSRAGWSCAGSDQIARYDSAAEALTACALDSNCLSIYDRHGTGTMYTCRSATGYQPHYVDGSCMYTPPPGSGWPACTSCPTGTFQPYGIGGPNLFEAEHADDPNDCLTCATGLNSGSNGTTCGDTLSECVAGQQFDARAGACAACSPGRYQPASRQTNCNECSAGTYSPGSTQLATWGRIPDRAAYVSCSVSTSSNPRGIYHSASEAFTACWLDARCLSVAGSCSASTASSGSWITCRSAIGIAARHDECLYLKPISRSGSTTCTSCPAGTYQPYGSGGANSFAIEHADDPSDCLLGCADSGIGIAYCHICATGYKNIQNGMCQNCPKDSMWVNSTNACGCLPGSYGSPGSCVQCLPGYAQPLPSQSNCTECAAGTYSAGSLQLSTWTLLPNRVCGESKDVIASYTSAAEALAACQLDTACLSVFDHSSECDGSGIDHRHPEWSTTLTWTTCRSVSGTSASGSLDPIPGSSPCLYQPPTNTTAGSMFCNSCPAGMYQPYGSGGLYAFQSEHATNISDCKACAAGFAQSAIGQTSQMACTECGAGNYSSGSLQLFTWTHHVRRRCSGSDVISGHGSHSVSEALARCWLDRTCLSVYNQNFDGYGTSNQLPGGPWQACRSATGDSGSSSDCLYTKPLNRSGSTTCSSCPAGTYQPYGSGGNDPSDCLLGCADSGIGIGACQVCSAGYAQVHAGQCTSCLPGYAAPQSGMANCSECDAGTYSQSTTRCTSCPAGTYQPYGSGGANSFAAEHADSGWDCLLGCADSGIGIGACQVCSAGYAQVHAGQCTSCLPGYAAPQSGMANCSECDAGTYSESTRCTSCPAGTYQPYGTGGSRAFEAEHADNSSDCLACPSDSTSSPGSALCKCVSGTHGSPGSCVDCLPGYAAPTDGMVFCAECDAGTFSSSAGSTACTSCPIGRIQPYGNGGLYAFDAQHADDLSDCGCNAGKSINHNQGGCVDCPFPERCLGFHCSPTSTGNLCGSCAQGYYSVGRFCAKCSDSPWTTILVAAIVLLVASVAVWKLSKQEPYKPPSNVDLGKHLGQGVATLAPEAQQVRKIVAAQHTTSVVGATKPDSIARTATAMHRSVHTLVASIVWPHFTFSLLPLMLPHMHWPGIVHDIAKWARSLAFLNIGVLQNPECLNDGADSTKKALTRLGLSHAGFWLVVALFTVVFFGGKLTAHSMWSQRAVNATVFAFMLAHALLLRSCLGVLHCVENVPSTDASSLFSNSSDTNLGRIFTDPDTACDMRTTWLLVWLMVALPIALFISRSRHELVRKYFCTAMACTCLPVMIQICRLLIWPEQSLAMAEYQLPALGTLGIVIYGFTLPKLLHRKIQKSVQGGYVNDPDFRARYGYLITRFKPGKWGSEFRILARKSALLVVTTILAETWYLVIPAQMTTLIWALYKQWVEHPFAEVGSQKDAFERDTPNGWSRGDVLEALSLGSQIAINMLSLATLNTASGLTVNSSGVDGTLVSISPTESFAIAVATLIFVLLPALYGMHILLTEWKVGRRSKKLAPSDTTTSSREMDTFESGSIYSASPKV
eukprot:COSAG01_NODE_1533_length_9989_cov_8.225581_1_plen_1653_part_00